MSRTSPLCLTICSLLLMAAPMEAFGQDEGGFLPPDESPPPLVTAPSIEEPLVVPEEEAYGGDTQHLVAITFSPIHLLMPVGELTGAYRLADELDVAAILGVGWISDPDSTLGFFVFEAGGQFRYYPLGYFEHGMQLGAEALFAHVASSGGGTTTGSGSAISLAPFIGYKVSANVGFTFEIQAGAAYTVMMASATSGSQTASLTDSGFGLMLNIGFGWAF